MKKKFKINLKSKHMIVIMTIVSLSLILATLSAPFMAAPVRNAAGYIIVPFQKGINAVGEWMTAQADSFGDVKELAEENRLLALVARIGMCKSNGEARKTIQAGGLYIGDEKVSDIDFRVTPEMLEGDGLLLRKGKKTYHRLVLG